jgi:pimeloyl-ACP methyl ester carboxylesterase
VTAGAPELDPGTLRHAEVDGLRTRYYQAGDSQAPALLLVHGGQYGSWYALDSWDTVLTPLAERFRVIALDRPGQGHTQSRSAPDGYRWDAGARHLERFVDEVLGGPAHIVGHSRGALLVAGLALRRPELVRSLTLVDAGSLAPEDAAYPRSEAFYARLAAPPPGVPGPEALRIEPEAQSVSTAHLTEDFVRRMVEIARLPAIVEARARMAELRATVFQPSLDEARREALAGIAERGLPSPTLVLWGAEDPSTPALAGERLAELVARRTPRSEMRLIERAGHYCFREQPSEFVRTLVGFLDGPADE